MKKRSLWKRLKHWRDQPLSFEQWQEAYRQGRYDEMLEWRDTLRRADLHLLQVQATAPRTHVVSKQQTQPLSLRQISGIADVRRSLKTTKLEPLPGVFIEDASDKDTQRVARITADDIAKYQNSFRNKKNSP